jgi:pyridoxamine 5'-phosphate oxidase
MTDLGKIRREYTRGGLHREDLTDHPIQFFTRWMEQARDADISDPTAMVVATVDDQGRPFQRTVLLKHFDEHGLVFYTNLASRKAQQIAANSQVSLHFPWHMFDRQVHINGRAEKLSQAEVLRYFITRPKESQISAWASKQSARITTRQILEGKFFELKKKFTEGEVPLPSFWGGYRVIPDSIEFWQGGEHRLHDRFLYTLDADCQWQVERLAP